MTPHQSPAAHPRRARARKIFSLGAGFVFALTGVGLASAPAAGESGAGAIHTGYRADTTLPGGRYGYVVSVVGGSWNRVGVRLAKYQFRTDGFVSQTAWSWSQSSISGKDNYTWTKPRTGYTTSGCRYNCHIRTPYNFQPGKEGYYRTGRWYRSSSGIVVINWTSTWQEKWIVKGGYTNVNGMQLVTSNPSLARGWALGSTVGLARGVSMAAFYQGGRYYGPMLQNGYNSATRSMNLGFNAPDYTQCTNGTCLQGVGNTDPDKRKWFSSYIATDPAKDGRKIFWNHQTGAVQQAESPGSVCISYGGGHTLAALQALDDVGRIIGLVGIEASLSQQATGQAIVSGWAMVKPGYDSLVN